VALLQGDVSVLHDREAVEPPRGWPVVHSLSAGGADPSQNVPKSMQVSANSDADLGILLSAILSNSLVFVGAMVAFCVLRRRFPLVYSHRLLAEGAEAQPVDSYLGWIPICAGMTTDEARQASGLDQAMLLEFCSLAMRIMLCVGAPQVLVLCPLHAWFGGHAAGNDRLSYIGFSNVKAGSWICWVHAFNVWYVVLVTMGLIYQAQRKFLPRRFEWLRSMRQPRSSTVLVEGIPEEYRSDAALQEYFGRMFSKEQVLSAYVVRMTSELAGIVGNLEAAEQALKKAEFKWEKTNRNPEQRPSFLGLSGAFEDEIEFYQGQISALEESAAEERARINDAFASGTDGVRGTSGFVTFRTSRDAVLAMQVRYREDREVFVSSVPPDPADVIWADLQADPVKQKTKSALGALAVFGLFCGFMPLVILLSTVTDLHNLQEHIGLIKSVCEQWPVVASVLDGVFSSLALNVLMGLLPTILMLIFQNFYQLKSEAWGQHRLQVCFFWFLLIFVVLITAVGNSLTAAMADVINKPMSVFSLLAKTLPQATHFYMNFMVLHSATHAVTLIRQMPLLKFLFFRTLYGEAEAKELAEPEDQDAYGIGSRSAWFSILMVTALVFCSLTPLMTVFAFVNFFLCRLVHSYLLVFAETKKADLGGVFWVSQLKHVQYGVVVYVFLMIGVLASRAATLGPCAFAAPTLAVWLYIRLKFSRSMCWVDLPFEEVVMAGSLDTQPKGSSHERYQQPELFGAASSLDDDASKGSRWHRWRNAAWPAKWSTRQR
jgi:hypothetical protein